MCVTRLEKLNNTWGGRHTLALGKISEDGIRNNDYVYKDY